MEVEQVEIRRHLAQHPPFDALSGAWLDEISKRVEIAYFRSGAQVIPVDREITELHYIRSGSVEIRRRNGEIYNRLAEGDIFGQLALMTGRPARFPVRALEDSLIYFIPGDLFRALFEQEETFADFVEIEDRTRLRRAASANVGGSALLTTRVGRLVRLHPITVSGTASVREAAAAMSAHDVSSVIVLADPAAGDGTERRSGGTSAQATIGIVTRSDLVERVLAEGVAHEVPVHDVMSSDPISVEADDYLFEALLVMLRNNIHHVPVISRSRLAGVVDLADVVGLETRSSLFVVRRIFLEDSVEKLADLLPDVEASFVRMVDEDANSHMIGSSVSAIGRSFKQRLLELGHERLGPPPVPYCLLALGSMARDEQVLHSDQDNAMVLDDDFDAARHGRYFEELAKFVCDGLARLGYRYCKGGFMATNDRWRKPLRAWKDEFSGWIGQPRPEALLHGSVFFDLDGAAGETRLADELKAFVAGSASRSPRFLGCLARNAQNRTPPLGFFRDFVLEKSGRYGQTINLKRRGTAPLVDVIRVHALASASQAQNSFERLDDIVAAGFLTGGMAADLRDAFEFISIIRIRDQAAKVEAGRAPDNNVDPEQLTRLERRSLKDAFTVLSNAQKFIKFRYRV